jgi:hypothetical protein
MKPAKKILDYNFEGRANSIEELFSSIKNGRFTLDGRDLIINGNLLLAGLDLISLVGCPQVVMGNFSCLRNHLKTLEGGPTHVTGYYNCAHNNLISLKGAPQHIANNFYCNNNQLPTLADGPVKVEGGYDCQENRLTSLVGCAEVIEGDFNALGNSHLVSLKGGPRFVGGDVYLSDCSNLTSIRDIYLHLPEVHGSINLVRVPVKGPLLGLLQIKGLRGIALDDKKLVAILNKHLPNGDIFECAVELAEAGYNQQAKL